MAPAEERGPDPTSHEIDRHVDEQPPREDLLEPGEIAVEDEDDEPAGLDPDELNVPERTGDPDRLPPADELPESQGDDVLTSERQAEDAGDRPPLHDEEP